MTNKQVFILALIIFIVGEVVGFSGMGFNPDMVLYSLVRVFATAFFPGVLALLVLVIGRKRDRAAKVLVVSFLVVTSLQTVMALVMS